MSNILSSRVESTHSQLKRWLGSATGGFDTIFPKLHSNIELQLNELKAQFEQSRTVVHTLTEKSFVFRQLSCNVSHKAFELMDEEWIKLETLKEANKLEGYGIDRCILRSSHGLPCLHEMFAAQQNLIPFDPTDINIFWRTLDMEATEELSTTRRSGDDLLRDLLSDIGPQSDVDKVVLSTRIGNVIRRHASELGEHATDKKHKGRPPNRKSTKRDPSDWEYVDKQFSGSQRSDPDIMSLSFPAQSEGQARRSTSTDDGGTFITDFPYPTDVPHWILKYIIGHTNVKGDGHCGFRCIALCVYGDDELWDLVRRELVQEMFENWELYWRALTKDVLMRAVRICDYHEATAPQRHWLCLTDLGLVVATRYQRILQCFSISSGCSHFLPLQPRLGGQTAPTEFITLALVHGASHFIKIDLRPCAPMPPGWPGWQRICDPNIQWWEQLWIPQKDLYWFELSQTV